jgi:hypothetical protein
MVVYCSRLRGTRGSTRGTALSPSCSARTAHATQTEHNHNIASHTQTRSMRYVRSIMVRDMRCPASLHVTQCWPCRKAWRARVYASLHYLPSLNNSSCPCNLPSDPSCRASSCGCSRRCTKLPTSLTPCATTTAGAHPLAHLSASTTNAWVVANGGCTTASGPCCLCWPACLPLLLLLLLSAGCVSDT